MKEAGHETTGKLEEFGEKTKESGADTWDKLKALGGNVKMKVIEYSPDFYF